MERKTRNKIKDVIIPIDEIDNKRRRTKTRRFEFDSLDNNELKLIQLVLKNSQKDVKHVEYDIPEAPTYYPTVEEFKDPLGYIRKIAHEAKQFGICKIVPPNEWNPPCQINKESSATFPTKRQEIHTLQESVGFDEGKHYNFKDYQKMATDYYNNWKRTHYDDKEMSYQDLAKDYWNMVDTRSKSTIVEYANDIEISKYQSGFLNNLTTYDDYTGIEPPACQDMFTDSYYSRCGWNLIHIARNQESLLKFLKSPINGINVPWLYIGMLFATFCWHNEDNYLYSINYSHFGEVKQWYGVPGGEAKNFESAVKDIVLELFKESPDLLHHMTTQISPSLLYGAGLPIYQLKQTPKSYIVTFPKSYHCGFSYGFNCGEAVNFALDDWLPLGGEAAERYRIFARPSVFSHDRLLFTLIKHRNEIRQELLSELASELIRIIDEEIVTRPVIFNAGIKDISQVVKLPKNNFDSIDQKALDFDDLRCCHLCKHFCIFSAIACECDRSNVSCIRHYNLLCKCPKHKQYLLAWASLDDLIEIKKDFMKLRTSVNIKINP